MSIQQFLRFDDVQKIRILRLVVWKIIEIYDYEGG